MFERKLRPRFRPRACLLERRWTPIANLPLWSEAEVGRLEYWARLVRNVQAQVRRADWNGAARPG